MNWKVHDTMDGTWGRTSGISPLLMRSPTAVYLMLLMRLIPPILDVFCSTNCRDKGVFTGFPSALSDLPAYQTVLCAHLSVWPVIHVPQNSTVMSVSDSAGCFLLSVPNLLSYNLSRWQNPEVTKYKSSTIFWLSGMRGSYSKAISPLIPWLVSLLLFQSYGQLC